MPSCGFRNSGAGTERRSAAGAESGVERTAPFFFFPKVAGKPMRIYRPYHIYIYTYIYIL